MEPSLLGLWYFGLLSFFVILSHQRTSAATCSTRKDFFISSMDILFEKSALLSTFIERSLFATTSRYLFIWEPPIWSSYFSVTFSGRWQSNYYNLCVLCMAAFGMSSYILQHENTRIINYNTQYTFWGSCVPASFWLLRMIVVLGLLLSKWWHHGTA